MYAIASRRNARVREWRRLRRPDLARRSSQVYIEGVRAVLQALHSSHRVRALLICPELARPETVRLVVRRVEGKAPVYRLSPGAFDSLSSRDGPSGVAAIMELRVGQLSQLSLRSDDVVVALWRVEKPGNLGTIVRTADSFGVQAVVLVDRCTNPYSPVAAKASMGALFRVPLVTCRDPHELRAWCHRQGAALVGTSARGAVPASSWQPVRPLVLLFGREGGGLSAEAVALCDQTVYIPMQGVNTSLNLATAVGILAYMARRERRI